MKKQITFGFQDNGYPIVMGADELTLEELHSLKRLIEAMLHMRLKTL